MRSVTCCCKAAIWLCKAAQPLGEGRAARQEALAPRRQPGQAALLRGEQDSADAGGRGSAGARRSALFCGHRGDGCGRGSCASASQRRSVLASMPRRCRRLGHRDKRHGDHSFRVGHDNKNESQPGDLPGKLPGVFPEQVPGRFPGELHGRLPGLFLGRPGGSTQRVSRLSGGDDDDSSQPNTDGCAATRTTDRSGKRKWAPARRDGPAGDGLQRG